MTRRILEAELQNPRTAELKAKIADAKVAMDQAGPDASAEESRRLIVRMGEAIEDLMSEVERHQLPFGKVVATGR